MPTMLLIQGWRCSYQTGLKLVNVSRKCLQLEKSRIKSEVPCLVISMFSYLLIISVNSSMFNYFVIILVSSVFSYLLSPLSLSVCMLIKSETNTKYCNLLETIFPLHIRNCKQKRSETIIPYSVAIVSSCTRLIFPWKHCFSWASLESYDALKYKMHGNDSKLIIFKILDFQFLNCIYNHKIYITE